MRLFLKILVIIGLLVFFVNEGRSTVQAANGCGGNLFCGIVNKNINTCEINQGICQTRPNWIGTGCDVVTQDECSGVISRRVCQFNSCQYDIQQISCCTNGGTGGGGGSCNSVTGNKYINGVLDSNPGQKVTLMPGYLYDFANSYGFWENPLCVAEGNCPPNQGHLIPYPADVDPPENAERFVESVTVPSGYNVSYNLVDPGVDAGQSRVGSGSSVAFLCRWGTDITIDWNFSPIVPPACEVGAPTIQSVSGSTITWTPGVKGTQQVLRVGTDFSQVSSGCHPPNDSSCVASPEFPEYTPVNPVSPQQMWYYRTDWASCTHTNSFYSTLSDCQANLATVPSLIGNTTLMCYLSEDQCNTHTTHSYTTGILPPGHYYWRVANLAACGYLDDIATSDVAPPPPLQPTCSISADSYDIPYNTSTNIHWSSTNATYCSVPPWEGLDGTPEGQPTGNLIATKEYTCTCSRFGVDSEPVSVTVTVDPPPIASAWWQVKGGNIHASSGQISSNIPATAVKPFLIKQDVSNETGLLSYGDGSLAPPSFGEGSLSENALTSWLANTTYNGGITNYTYFERKLADDPLGIDDTWSGGQPDPGPDGGVYRGSVAQISGADWSVNGGDKIVILVPNDLRIDNNITVSAGSFLAIIVQGSLTIGNGVTNLQGVYIADGAIDTGNGANQLSGQGIFVGWGGINLGRDLAINNNTSAAEDFTYRVDLQRNAYKYLLGFDFSWQEVAP